MVFRNDAEFEGINKTGISVDRSYKMSASDLKSRVTSIYKPIEANEVPDVTHICINSKPGKNPRTNRSEAALSTKEGVI
ncbi:hypothetical protein JTE90_010444 [Oedothorax gibbosus]|uniref:Uncharacterized protein n=1 Tax=Oedothorax gibbosus TaxID=931172 RepID=A0AAV6W5N0_9ARAC|nr:hypothetical protein JTE90_010444 [Oedothorax gibbosus]